MKKQRKQQHAQVTTGNNPNRAGAILAAHNFAKAVGDADRLNAIYKRLDEFEALDRLMTDAEKAEFKAITAEGIAIIQRNKRRPKQ